jgi:hypothetical protein
MSDQDRVRPDDSGDLFSRRLERIELDPTRLNRPHREILDRIRASCPACENPDLCAAGLAGTAECGWEAWDEYCPNADRLRVLAALTMFPREKP